MKKLLILVFALFICLTATSAFAAEMPYTGVFEESIEIDKPGEHTIILNGVTLATEHNEWYTEYYDLIIKSPAKKVTIVLKDGTTNNLGYIQSYNGDSDIVIRCENAGEGHKCTDNCGKLFSAYGIGSGDYQDFTGSITIIGGNIIVNTIGGGAIIGSGYCGKMSGVITIAGGNIIDGNGDIGSGSGGDMIGTITITGSNISLDGGIGSRYQGEMSGTIAITGSNISSGLGIGSGGDGDMSGTITIADSNVTVGLAGSGIGSGWNGDFTGTITIADSIVIADGSSGVGIGGGYNGSECRGTITITDSTVNINAGWDWNSGICAGIGSGGSCDFTGAVTIANSTINTTSENGAGIGSGKDGDFTGIVTITDCTVTANSKYGAGIGAGENGEFRGKLIVNSSDVTASSIYYWGIGPGHEGPFSENAEVYVHPGENSVIEAKQGFQERTAVNLAGSPFSTKTNLVSLLDGSRFVRFRHNANIPTPSPSPDDENQYKAKGEISLYAWAHLLKADLKGGEFTFVLAPYNEQTGVAGSVIATATNDAEGNVIFPALQFTEKQLSGNPKAPAVYSYLVREKQGEDETVIYSTQQFVYHISVQDNYDGTLLFEQEVLKKEGNTLTALNEAPVFVNDLKNGGLTIAKIVEGDNPEPDREFNFKVKFTSEYALKFMGMNSEETSLLVDTSNQFHATEDQLKGDAYAVLDTETGEFIFFRAEKIPGKTHRLDFLGREFTMVGDTAIVGNLVYFYVNEKTENFSEWPWCKNDYYFKIKYIAMKGAIKPKSTSWYFSGTSLEEIDLSLLDTSDVTNMSGMFMETGFWGILDLTTFDTSRVTDMSGMFSSSFIFRVDLSSFDTSHVQHMDYMFHGYQNKGNDRYWRYGGKIQEVDLSNFDFSSVVSMYEMFSFSTRLRAMTLKRINRQQLEDKAFFDGVYPYQMTIEDDTILNEKDVDDYYGFTAKDALWFNKDDITQQLTAEEIFLEGGHAGTWLKGSPEDYIIATFDDGNGGGKVIWIPRSTIYPEWGPRNDRIIKFYHKSDLGYENNGYTLIGVRIKGDEEFLFGNPNMIEAYYYPPRDDMVLKDTAWIDTSRPEFEGVNSVTFIPVWEKLPSCTLTFNANGGTGSLENKTIAVEEKASFQLPFQREGYQLVAMKDQYGKEYPVSVSRMTIRANTYKEGDVVKLTAVWEPLSEIEEDTEQDSEETEKTTVKETVKEFTLKAGEQITLTEIPAGTTYEVWEETPAGWQLYWIENGSGVIEPLEITKVEVFNGWEPEATYVWPKAYKQLDGVPSKEEFVFAAYAEESDFIVPLELYNANGVIAVELINFDGSYSREKPYVFWLSEITDELAFKNWSKNLFLENIKKYPEFYPDFEGMTDAEIDAIFENELQWFWDYLDFTADPTIDYDTSAYRMEFLVGTDTVDGQEIVTCELTYTDAEGNALDGPPVFRNTHKPGNLKIEKVITGDLTEKAKNQNFTVEVSFADKNYEEWNGTVNVNGMEVKTLNGAIALSMKGGDSVTITGIPHNVRYWVKEIGNPSGWKMDEIHYGVIEATETDEVKVVNRYNPLLDESILTTFTVKKVWKGLGKNEAAPAIELVLYCNGEATDVKTPTPNSRGEYIYNLPAFANGKPAVYTVKEVPTRGCTTIHETANGVASDYADNGGRIINTLIPATGDPFPLAFTLMLTAVSALMLAVIRRKSSR